MLGRGATRFAKGVENTGNRNESNMFTGATARRGGGDHGKGKRSRELRRTEVMPTSYDEGDPHAMERGNGRRKDHGLKVDVW